MFRGDSADWEPSLLLATGCAKRCGVGDVRTRVTGGLCGSKPLLLSDKDDTRASVAGRQRSLMPDV